MIFCVEDDAGIRNMVVYTLRSTGFEAEGFADGDAFFAALEEHKPQLVLLDIMLPGEDGLTILRKLRDTPATSEIPVIMATAKGSEYDKVTGLDQGADVVWENAAGDLDGDGSWARSGAMISTARPGP